MCQSHIRFLGDLGFQNHFSTLKMLTQSLKWTEFQLVLKGSSSSCYLSYFRYTTAIADGERESAFDLP